MPLDLAQYREFAFIAAANQNKSGAEFEEPLARFILSRIAAKEDFSKILTAATSQVWDGDIDIAKNLSQVLTNLEKWFAIGVVDDVSVAAKIPRPTIFAKLACSKYTDIQGAIKVNPPFALQMKLYRQDAYDPEKEDNFHIWIRFWRNIAPWSTLLRVAFWQCKSLGLPQYVQNDFERALGALLEQRGDKLECMGESVTDMFVEDAGESSIAGVPTIYKQKIKRLLESLAVLHRITELNPYATVSIFSKGYSKEAFKDEFKNQTSLTSNNRFTAENAAQYWDTAERKANESAFDGFKLIHDERGTGIPILDEKRPKIDLDVMLAVKAQTEKTTSQQIVPPTYENLFGSHAVDLCPHGCNSVLSPLAYFVDLLQFLRQTKTNAEWESDPLVKDEKYSLLMHFAARRPDILNLELSCENNILTIPYIDLVNEVMESWIYYNVAANPNKNGASVSDPSGSGTTVDSTKPKELYSSGVEIRNNSYGAASEQLAAKPTYVSETIYKGSIGSTVFPIGVFPYNYAFDRSRTILKAMGTSRLDIIRLHDAFSADNASDERKKLVGLWGAIAQAIESLGLFPEDLEPLTGQKFDVTKTPSESQSRVHEFWGYTGDTGADDMNDVSETRTGLAFIKEQFLARSGITLRELIELLKSDFINWDPSGIPGEIRVEDSQSKKIIIEIPEEDLKQAKLVQFDKSKFDPKHWDRFQQFIRLYKKVNCSISELDQVLLAAWGRERLEKLERPELTIDTLVEVAAIFDVVKECGLELHQALAFWTDFRPKSGSKLYNALFLDPRIATHYPVFQSLSEGKDASQLNLGAPEAIQDNIEGLLAGLGIKRQDYGFLKATLKNHHGSGNPDVSDIDRYLRDYSQIYRLSLLCKITGIPPADLGTFLECPFMKDFQNPFARPGQTLKFLRAWNTFKAHGFSADELLLLDGNAGDICLAVAYDSMSRKERDSVDRSLVVIDRLSRAARNLAEKYKNPAEVSSEDVERLASALFDRATVIRILAFLNCQPPYANPPAGPEASEDAGPMSSGNQAPQNSEHKSDPIASEMQEFYDNNIAELLLQNEADDKETIKTTLLKTDSSGKGEKSILAAEKRKVFYKALSYNLQNKEYDLEAIQTLLSCKVSGMNEDVIRGLLLRASMSLPSALDSSVREDLGFLKALSRGPISDSIAGVPLPTSTHAFLKPDTSDVFRFILAKNGDQKFSIKIDGKSYVFSEGYEGSNSVVTPPLALMSNHFYLLEVPNKSFEFGKLRWRGVKSADTEISAACWTERSLQNSIECKVLLKLDMLGLVMERFSLTLQEILTIEKDKIRFQEINFGNIDLKTLSAIQRYVELRDNVGPGETISGGLLPLFNIVDNNPTIDDKTLPGVLSKATGWPEKNIKGYLELKRAALQQTEGDTKTTSTDVDPTKTAGAQAGSPGTTLGESEKDDQKSNDKSFESFVKKVTEINELIKIRDVVRVLDSLKPWDIQVSQLKEWCSPGGDPYEIAGTLEKIYDSKTPKVTWLATAGPRVYDGLRERRRRALQSFILQQPEMRKSNILDADALFEYFMIDVQMSSSMKTSRLRQAISAIQLFIQRCLLNLESPNVPRSCIRQKLWSWMSKYTLWEANRRTFLFPENWLEPTLRDTKSDPFKEFESSLMQKNLTKETIDQSIRNYVYSSYNLRSLAMQAIYNEKFETGNLKGQTAAIHYFGRTLGAPYKYYYRKWTEADGSWTPWSEINVSIVTHETDTQGFTIDGPGAFLVPVVWNQRLFLFLPTFKTAVAKLKLSDADGESVKFEAFNKINVDTRFTIPYHQIYLGWTEFRDGKWAPLQTSSDYVVEYNCFKIRDEQFEFSPGKQLDDQDVPTAEILQDLRPPTSAFHFTSNTGPTNLYVNIFRQTRNSQSHHSRIGQFEMSSGIVKAKSDKCQLDLQNLHSYSRIKRDSNYLLFSNQMGAETTEMDGTETHPFITPNLQVQTYSDPEAKRHMNEIIAVLGSGTNDKAIMSNEMAPSLIEQSLNPVESLFTTFAEKFGTIDTQAFGNLQNTTTWHELRTPAALYNWELAVHVPMLIMDRLASFQQFDLALEVGRYIFNPFVVTQDLSMDLNACWSWPPFSTLSGRQAMNSILGDPQAPESSDTRKTIEEWRKAPFVPYVVARNRPIAYMKWVVMKYLDTLVAYGDYYFRQNSLESIPLATQLYIEAAHIFGNPEVEPARMGTMKTTTYQALIDQNNMDSFSNSSIKMEYMFPFAGKVRANNIPENTSQSVAAEIAKSILGLRATRYFGLPLNPRIKEIGSLIQDRLGKIRACLDINGVPQHLPLFDAPIDPGMLVQAASSGDGGGLGAALFYVDQPMPNYRFHHVLQKALEVCQELKGYESTYLSVREKCDAEALSSLRCKQDLAIGALTQDLKELALGEANKAIESLKESRRGPESRMKYFLRLLGEDAALVPGENTMFTEIEQSIDKPTSDDLRLNISEVRELEFADKSHSKSEEAAQMELAASVLHLIPSIAMNLSPLGCGTAVDYGAQNIAAFLSTVASFKRVDADNLSFESSRHARRGGLLSQVQERRLQANICGYELNSIDSQIRAQEIRIKAAQKDVDTIILQREHMKQYDDFLRSKFTSEELYTWLDNTYRQTYFQTYNLAFDIARSAERAYKFEKGDDSAQFISLNKNWNSTREGLGAAEELYLSLKRLELAYMERKPHDYEIRKNVSLRQIDPIQLHELRETGTAEFEIPEILYDMDFPGHYQRRIKTVSISIPCIAGSYQSISCVLRLLDHRYRSSTSRLDSYKESTTTPDDRFRSIRVPVTSISTSSANNDSGIFELNFQDERYVPFEGAGAISRWRVELPKKYKQFNYDTISDVVLHVRYTSKDGGGIMRQKAEDNLETLFSGTSVFQLHSVIDIPSDYSNEWYRGIRASSATTPSSGKITLENIQQQLPFHSQSAISMTVASVYVYTDVDCDSIVLKYGVDQGETSIAFGPRDPAEPKGKKPNIFKYISVDTNTKREAFAFDSSWRLELGQVKNAATAKRFWLVFRNYG
ncbi:hypothetical protein TWF192_007101 [Orbilia oligospora]|nr:hypothetical protein TWF192_007101 [Orbilia oligospora]